MLTLEQAYKKLQCCYIQLISQHAKNVEKLVFDEVLNCKIAEAYGLLKAKAWIQDIDLATYNSKITEICGESCDCCGDEYEWIGIDPICEEVPDPETTTTTSTSTSTSTSTTSSTSTTTPNSPPPVSSTSTSTTSTTSSTTTSTPSGGGSTSTTTTSTSTSTSTTSSTSTTTGSPQPLELGMKHVLASGKTFSIVEARDMTVNVFSNGAIQLVYNEVANASQGGNSVNGFLTNAYLAEVDATEKNALRSGSGLILPTNETYHFYVYYGNTGTFQGLMDNIWTIYGNPETREFNSRPSAYVIIEIKG